MSYKKKTEWQDFYIPKDFYGWASGIAKRYCKTHPEADKSTVYYAASEAAEMYEFSSKLRYKPFKNFVYFRIHTAVYIKNRKEDEKLMIRITPELKASMIKDYESGMTVKEIAERYQLNPKITYNNFNRWSQKGLVELRTPKKPEHIKREPAPAEAETSPSQEIVNNNIAQNAEVVNPMKAEAEEQPAPRPEKSERYIEVYGYYLLETIEAEKTVFVVDKEKAEIKMVNTMTAEQFAKLLKAVEYSSEERSRYYMFTINKEDGNV